MNFEIIGKKVKLRPFKESDIDDKIKWMTEELEWQEWDAPWEKDDDFVPETYRKERLERLKKEEISDFYYSLEIETLDTGKHIGGINSYYIDKNYNYIKHGSNFTIGIGINNPNDRKKGYATEAWVLFINYALKEGIKEIYTQTWSGNYPVIALMKKIGFELIHIKKNYHEVNNKPVDGYTFKLNLEKFHKLNKEGY